ncbi:putative membrane protein [Undibacterium sp. GrIS 1.8]|uniref:DUF1700 domain-containing protein n=1 Tax=Undibacterium sp. GrIS 1.8 TaxID=3143934 RepID=UPI00339456C7
MDYEQHFIEAVSAGREMEEVSRALGDPRKIALEFKAILHLNAFQKKQSLGNFGRMVFSFISVVWLNLFMLPFVATVSLLFVSLYLVSLSCLIGGTLIVASGFFNLNDIVHMESASGKIGLHVPPYTIAYYSNAEKDLSNSVQYLPPVSVQIFPFYRLVQNDFCCA